MLSVFMTPWMKPQHPFRDQFGLARDHRGRTARDRARPRAGVRVVAGDDVIAQQIAALDVARRAKNWKVPTRIWLDARRVSTARAAPFRAAQVRGRDGSQRPRGGNAQRAIASLMMYSRSTGQAARRHRGARRRRPEP